MINKLNINDFVYDLPEEYIAKYPKEKRDSSKLLYFDGKEILQKSFYDLPDLLNRGDFIVINNTKVIKARMVLQKQTGGKIEIFCLEPVMPENYNEALKANKSCRWRVMIGRKKRWKGERLYKDIIIEDKKTTLYINLCNHMEDMTYQVDFLWDNDNITFNEILDYAGELPIPPYLNRKTETKDYITYQTTYSKALGSVAAPTAGLHFTDDIFKKLDEKGIKSTEITLNIGAGTFKPIKDDDITKHKMHAEMFSISVQAIMDIIENIGHIVAVGTTSVRTLESLYYIGVHIDENQEEPNLNVSQWEAYQRQNNRLSTSQALWQIVNYMKKREIKQIEAQTEIMIVPDFKFRIVGKMITNFHQPQSTLLLLIEAFIGREERLKIYKYAIENGFRFLSYGDSSLLENKNIIIDR